MSQDWARFQGATPQLEWAVTNAELATILFRAVAAEEPAEHLGSLALALNNLGSLLFDVAGSRRRTLRSSKCSTSDAYDPPTRTATT
jgi:hypothetical protein